jgi:hypothetical protein
VCLRAVNDRAGQLSVYLFTDMLEFPFICHFLASILSLLLECGQRCGGP